MSIKDSKEAAFGPIFNVLFGRRLHNIQNDADSVFIIVSYYALVCVGRITYDASILSNTALGGLPTWKI